MMDKGEVLDKHQMDIEKKVAEKLHLQTHKASAAYGRVKEGAVPSSVGITLAMRWDDIRSNWINRERNLREHGIQI